MPIRTQCESCGKAYSLKDELAGKKIRCPNCKAVLVVPGGGAPKKGSKRTASPGGKTPGGNRVGPPPSTSGRKPPRPSAVPRAEKDQDPNATVVMGTPAIKRKQDAARIAANKATNKAARAAPTECPECGKPLKKGNPTCEWCGYNIKLRRKMSIRTAIESASLESGIRADGTTYKTRKEVAAERVAQGEKVRYSLIGFVGLVILLALFLVWQVIRISASGIDPDEKRWDVLPRTVRKGDALSAAGHFFPWCAGMKVRVVVAKSRIRNESPADAAGDTKEGGASTAFAEAFRLPTIATPGKVYASDNPRLLDRIRELDGTYGPVALEGARPDSVWIWRKAGTPDEGGYLDGALLDFGDRRSGAEDEMELRGRYVAIRGTLTHVVSRDSRFAGGSFTWAFAVREGMSRIPPPPPGTEPGASGPGNENLLFFHPVIQVESINSQKSRESE